MAQSDSDPFPDPEYNTQYNMSITGQVRINGEALPDGTIVAAYCGDEIRGKEVIFSQGPYINLLMIVISGDRNGDPLHFKVFTEGRIIETDPGIVFESDLELGRIKNYYYIDLPAPIVSTPSTEGWATTCLPFNAAVPEGVKIWNATGIEDGELVMEEVTGTILPANTPVLLQSEGKTSYEWLSRVAEGNVSTEGCIFKGTTETTTVEASSVLTLGHNNDSGEIGFWCFSGTSIPAYRAYIDEFPTGMRGVPIRPDHTTGIQTIDSSTKGRLQSDNGQLMTNDVYYDLSGRRVENPTKGMFIVNGQKVVIK
ncbi:MAG: hypothetical protein IJP46_03090 [Prevotella sp.]|nr:hypothetical protein [Prevotella sp.]